MGTKEFIIFAFAFCTVGVCQAQYYGRMRGLNCLQKEQCTCSCEDLAALIALARALEEKEITPHRPPPPPTPCLSNFEELIMKLVNALVYTATETTKNSCHCTRSTTTNPNSNSNSDDGLINAEILDLNKHNNLLNVGLGDQNLLGLGLGGKNHDGAPPTGSKPPGHNTTGQNPGSQHPPGKPTGDKYPGNSNSDEGFINVELLNQNRNDNVLGVDIGKQTVVGVALGGNGGTTPTSHSGYTNNPTNSGEGLINLAPLDT